MIVVKIPANTKDCSEYSILTVHCSSLRVETRIDLPITDQLCVSPNSSLINHVCLWVQHTAGSSLDLRSACQLKTLIFLIHCNYFVIVLWLIIYVDCTQQKTFERHNTRISSEILWFVACMFFSWIIILIIFWKPEANIHYYSVCSYYFTWFIMKLCY